MPRKITTTLYKFDELDPKAKAKARDWFREGNGTDSWWEPTYEDASRVATLLGITLREDKHGKLSIQFSGFSSQGDGASFEGTYTYKADALAAIQDYAPKDTRLHAIASSLQAAQDKAQNRIAFTITTQGNYCHSGSIFFELDATEEDCSTISREAAREVITALRSFADWIYAALEAENDYQNADSTVTENIILNEYEFTKDGTIHLGRDN